MPKPETPGFFAAADGTPLYGVYHAPGSRASFPRSGQAESEASGTAAVRGVVVIAPPLFEERKSAFGALIQLARALAGAGLGVLRFDYRGSGESGGDSAARRWPHLGEDLEAACAAARKLSGCQKVSLCGVRLGATLALAESTRCGAERCIAIAPVLKGSTEVRLWRLRSKMRSELSASVAGTAVAGSGAESGEVGQGARGPVLDLDGFPVHPGFFDDLQQVDLTNVKPCAQPALIVQVSHRDAPSTDYARLAERLGAQTSLACVKALPFWERVEDAEVSGVVEQVVRYLSS